MPKVVPKHRGPVDLGARSLRFGMAVAAVGAVVVAYALFRVA